MRHSLVTCSFLFCLAGAAACSSGGEGESDGQAGSAGQTGSGGQPGSGGAATGGGAGTGGQMGTGGAAGSGGLTGTGGAAGSAGQGGSGGQAGGAGGGAAGAAGQSGSGGQAGSGGGGACTFPPDLVGACIGTDTCTSRYAPATLTFLTNTCNVAMGTVAAGSPCPTDNGGNALLGCCVSPPGALVNLAMCQYANHAATEAMLKASCESNGNCWASGAAE